MKQVVGCDVTHRDDQIKRKNIFVCHKTNILSLHSLVNID